MDPDVIFIMLLYLIMLGLTIGCIIGLSRKIWLSEVSIALKIFVIGVLVGLLILALLKFDGVETRDVIISRWTIMIYSASFLIGLNWSINLTKKQAFLRLNAPSFVKAAFVTICFTIIIPTTFYFLANLLVKLNLFGSGG